MAHANDNTKPCQHEWTASLTEPGLLCCVWCPAKAEAPASPIVGVDVPVGVRVVLERRVA